MSHICIALAQRRSHENVKFDVYDKHYEETCCQMTDHRHTPPPPREKKAKKVTEKQKLRVTSVSLSQHTDVSKNNVRISRVTISSIFMNQEMPF